MSNKLINPEYSVIRASEEDSGGGGAATMDESSEMGLVDGLDKFLEENPDAPAIAEAEEAPASPDENTTKKSGEVFSGEDEDFGLPTLNKEPSDDSESDPGEDEGFDESAFDEETKQEVVGLDPAKGDAWKKLKEELKGYKKGETQLSDLQNKLENLEKENSSLRETADEVEAIKTRMKSVTSRNAELLLEESEDYRKDVINPHQEISSTISALAEAKDIPEDDIWDVIKEQDPAKRISSLDELERQIGARNSLLVQNMANDMRVIAFKDKEMRENAEAIVNQARSADARVQEEQSASRTADFKTSAKQAFTLHGSKIPGFMDDSGMLTDSGRAAQANTTTVDVDSLSSGDLAYMAFATEALPQSLRMIRDLEKENRDLRVAAGDSASDILPGGSKKKASEEEDDEDMGLLDHMKKQIFDSAI